MGAIRRVREDADADAAGDSRSAGLRNRDGGDRGGMGQQSICKFTSARYDRQLQESRSRLRYWIASAILCGQAVRLVEIGDGAGDFQNPIAENPIRRTAISRVRSGSLRRPIGFKGDLRAAFWARDFNKNIGPLGLHRTLKPAICHVCDKAARWSRVLALLLSRCLSVHNPLVTRLNAQTAPKPNLVFLGDTSPKGCLPGVFIAVCEISFAGRLNFTEPVLHGEQSE
jgi:hypothetical protein